MTKEQYFKELKDHFVNDHMIFCPYLGVNDLLIFYCKRSYDTYQLTFYSVLMRLKKSESTRVKSKKNAIYPMFFRVIYKSDIYHPPEQKTCRVWVKADEKRVVSACFVT
jgi:hypothetical protein